MQGNQKYYFFFVLRFVVFFFGVFFSIISLTSSNVNFVASTVFGNSILILPFKMKEKTKGGILLPDSTRDDMAYLTTVGQVVALGDLAYHDMEKFPKGPWCKKGTWVVFARYAGSRIKIDGGEVRLLNDDEVLATVENPEDIFHEI